MRAAIGLEAKSRALLIVTEGATDPDRYRELVGITPADLAGNARPSLPSRLGTAKHGVATDAESPSPCGEGLGVG